jgi:hypothetical protein
MLVGEWDSKTILYQFNNPGGEVGFQRREIFKNNGAHQFGKLITVSANVLTQNVTDEELPALFCALHFSLCAKCIM